MPLKYFTETIWIGILKGMCYEVKGYVLGALEVDTDDSVCL